MERLLTVKELAAITGWSVFTIYQKAEKIPGRLKLDKSLRFRESDVKQWIDGKNSPPLVEGVPQ